MGSGENVGRGGLRGGSRTLQKCGADLPTGQSVCGLLYEVADLRIWTCKRGYLLTYRLISLKRSCGLYESTELPINQIINQSLYHYVLHILRIADLYTDLWGCTYGLAGLSMTWRHYRQSTKQGRSCLCRLPCLLLSAASTAGDSAVTHIRGGHVSRPRLHQLLP